MPRVDGNEAAATVRVIHRHRIGGQRPFTRVSELTYSQNRPIAVLSWLTYEGMRTPCVWVELDPSRLRSGADRRVYVYDGVTTDPRYVDPNQQLTEPRP
jgi:hypothetical protein